MALGNSIKDKAALCLATGIGLGYLPWAPGTWGSVLGILLAVGLQALSLLIASVSFLSFVLLAIWTSQRSCEILGQKDPSQVVIDEVAGMALTLLGHPLDPVAVILGFLFFRFFDILKPFPVRHLERRLPGGIGIVADDLAAGVLANLSLRLVGGLHVW